MNYQIIHCQNDIPNYQYILYLFLQYPLTMHKGELSNTFLKNHQLYCLDMVGYKVF
jgi:hypothetical protein